MSFKVVRIASPEGEGMGPVLGVAVAGRFLYEASYSGDLVVRDVGSHEILDVATTAHLMTSVAVSPDGKFVVAGTADGHGLVFRFDGRLTPVALVPTRDDVEAVAFTTDSRRVLLGGQDRLVTAASLDGQIVGVHDGHRGVVNGIRALKDGRIASAADDGEVHIWNVESPHNFEVIRLDDDINALAIDSNGSILAGCDRGRITVAGSTRYIEAHASAVKAIVVHTAGLYGISVGYDQRACLFRIGANGLEIDRHIDLPGEIWPKGVCFASEDKVVFGTFRNGSAVYDLRAQRFLNLEGLDPYPSFNAVCMHAGAIYAAGDSGQVFHEGRMCGSLPCSVNTLVSTHGLLVAAGQSGIVANALTGEVYAAFGRPVNTIVEAIGGSRKVVYVGLYGGAVAELEFHDGRLRQTQEVTMHGNAIKGLAAHAGTICAVAADGSVSFTNIGATALDIASRNSFPQAHTQIANGVAVTTDGSFCSVGRDRKLLVWQSRDRAVCYSAPVRNSLKSVATWDRFVAVGDYRGMVAVLDRKTDNWVFAQKISRWGIASVTASESGFVAATFGGELLGIEVASRSASTARIAAGVPA